MSQQFASQAGRGQVANSRVGGDYTPGMAGGRVMQQQCAFPAPPPRRIYCQNAQFSQVDGMGYARLLSAYGSSRPHPGGF